MRFGYVYVIIDVVLKLGQELTKPIIPIDLGSGKVVYGVGAGIGSEVKFIVCLAYGITPEEAEAVGEYVPGRIVFADACFGSLDQKSNARLALKYKGIAIKALLWGNYMDIDGNKNCDEIEVTDEGITIIARDKDGNKTIVPYRNLNWRNPYEDGDDYDLPLFLTLKEIREQLLSFGYKPLFYVWYEQGLSGVIYQYGNYPEINHWLEHGKTKGYA